MSVRSCLETFFVETIVKKPSERFELSTPGLQDQCSNPWATKATSTTIFPFSNSRSVLRFYFRFLLKGSVRLAWIHTPMFFMSVWVSKIWFAESSFSDHSAVTRIRTWVIAATTQCTNHYTITATSSWQRHPKLYKWVPVLIHYCLFVHWIGRGTRLLTLQ